MFKYKRLIAGALIVFVSVSSVVIVFQRNYVIPILMYHSVRPDAHPENRLVVSPQSFERQMRFLKERGYNVLPLEAIAALSQGKSRVMAKAVVITFDDGYKDNYTYAFPILKKYNLPATISIIVNEVGRPDRLSWEEIKEMRDSGIFTVASHAIGPEPLVNIKSEEELKRQIFDSKKMLEEKLGGKIQAFSYPEGRFNERIKELVIAAGYKFAVATNPGRQFSNRDIFALKRLRISENAGNLFIFWVESSGFYNFMRERRHK